jgi:hypothetical protein
VGAFATHRRRFFGTGFLRSFVSITLGGGKSSSQSVLRCEQSADRARDARFTATVNAALFVPELARAAGG